MAKKFKIYSDLPPMSWEEWKEFAMNRMENTSGHPDERAEPVPSEFYDEPELQFKQDEEYSGSAMFPGRIYYFPDGSFYKT